MVHNQIHTIDLLIIAAYLIAMGIFTPYYGVGIRCMA